MPLALPGPLPELMPVLYREIGPPESLLLIDRGDSGGGPGRDMDIDMVSRVAEICGRRYLKGLSCGAGLGERYMPENVLVLCISRRVDYRCRTFTVKSAEVEMI